MEFFKRTSGNFHGIGRWLRPELGKYDGPVQTLVCDRPPGAVQT